MNIIVLAGGLSPERHVSLVSGTSICRALRNLGHKAVLVDMFLGLEDYEGDLADLFDAPGGLCGEAVIHTEAPDLEQVRRSRRDQSSNLFGPGVLQACAMADIVFLGLHGTCGEDGRVQAAFDLLGIPYTGAGYLASGMAMNKAVTKQIMERCGILTPPWRELIYSREDIPRLARELPVPSAVKVIDGGSSLGVSLPETREELAAALEENLGYGGHVIVERKITGRDIAIGVLWRSFPEWGATLTTPPSTRTAAAKRCAPPPSQTASGGRWGRRPCGSTGPLACGPTPGRTSFWMRTAGPGAWRSTPCRG